MMMTMLSILMLILTKDEEMMDWKEVMKDYWMVDLMGVR